MQARYADWLSSAENDLAWGHDNLAHGFYAQACYISQQVAEKSLKALAFFRGYDRVKSHSVVAIVRELGINGLIEERGKRLDQYYIPARYPDAFPSGAPHEFFSKEQADEALGFAQEIFHHVEKIINNNKEPPGDV